MKNLKLVLKYFYIQYLRSPHITPSSMSSDVLTNFIGEGVELDG